MEEHWTVILIKRDGTTDTYAQLVWGYGPPEIRRHIVKAVDETRKTVVVLEERRAVTKG